MVAAEEMIIGLTLSTTVLILNITEVLILIGEGKNRKLKTNHQRLVASLAFSDFLVALSLTALQGYTLTLKINSTIVENFFQEIPWACVASSLFHPVLISADRLLAVRFPVKHKLQQAKMANMVFIAVIWLTTIASAIPFLFIQRSAGQRLFPASLVLALGVGMILSYVYLIRKSVSVGCIVHILKINGVREAASPCSPKEKKALRVSLAVVLCCIIFNFPFVITNVTVGKANSYVSMLLVINTIVNPVLFMFDRKLKKKKQRKKVNVK